MNSIVVHYQELALKGKNRPWFLARLVRNLREAVSDLDVQSVRALMGRIEIVVKPGASREEVGERIRRTFGVANFSYAGRTALDLDIVSQAIIRDLGDRTCESFRVSARRADKRFPLTSPQVEREVGGRIQEARGWRVNLDEPALTIHVELLTDQAFYFFGKERGPGGLPTGTAGRVVCLLSGGIDSPVAAHRMMKRGCAVTFVHFHSYPILSRASQEKVRELVQLLTKWQHRSQLNLVAFGEIQQQVVLSVPGPMRVVIYRRLMMRIAEAIAKERRAQALITGDVVGQVASQTLENLAVIGSVVTLPVFRPLIGMDKEEITTDAIKIGTYPISIIPDQDCCTLFTPRNPLTRARLGEIEAAERALPIYELVARAVNDAIVEYLGIPRLHERLGRCRIENQSRKPRVQSQRRGMTVASTAAVELTVPGIKGITSILGDDARLLEHQCKTIPKDSLLLPGPDYVDRAYGLSDRSPRVLGALQSMLNTGRLGGTGYVSILPVDQGIEHSAGASFAPNPLYFDSENIVKLAIEGGCNAVASTLGVLGSVSRRYAHKIPFILKFNHNEFISYPNTYDQIRFASVKQAYDMGALAVGATIYFGSEESKRQIQEVAAMFQQAHEYGMFTVLWCYLRNPAFKTKDVDYHVSADLTGQANHLGVTIEADIIKQKMPENNGGYNAVNFGKTHKAVYSQLTSDNPIDLTRYQLANCYMGRAGLINSGGAASGEGDLKEAVKTAVINKRAGGMGLISGRKAFQRPMKEGAALLNAIQDVYLTKEVTIA